MSSVPYLSPSSQSFFGPSSASQYNMSSYHPHTQYSKLPSPYEPACESTKLHTPYTTPYGDQTSAAFASHHSPLDLGISAAQRLAAAF